MAQDEKKTGEAGLSIRVILFFLVAISYMILPTARVNGLMMPDILIKLFPWLLLLIFMLVTLISLSEAARGINIPSPVFSFCSFFFCAVSFEIYIAQSNLHKYIMWIPAMTFIGHLAFSPLPIQGNIFAIITRIATVSLILGGFIWLGYTEFWTLWRSPDELRTFLPFIEFRYALFAFALAILFIASVFYAVSHGLRPYKPIFVRQVNLHNPHSAGQIFDVVIKPIYWLIHIASKVILFVINFTAYIFITASIIIVSAFRYYKLFLNDFISRQNLVLLCTAALLILLNIGFARLISQNIFSLWDYIAQDAFVPPGTWTVLTVCIMAIFAIPIGVTLTILFGKPSLRLDETLSKQCFMVSGQHIVEALIGILLAAFLLYISNAVLSFIDAQFRIFGFVAIGVYFSLMITLVLLVAITMGVRAMRNPPITISTPHTQEPESSEQTIRQ